MANPYQISSQGSQQGQLRLTDRVRGAEQITQDANAVRIAQGGSQSHLGGKTLPLTKVARS
jgi:hypothetical protein